MGQDANPIESLAEAVFEPARQQDGPDFDGTLWQRFLESGLDQVLCTGEETALVDCTRVLRVAGRRAANIPACEAILSRYLDLQAGWEPERALTSVITSPGDWDAVPWGGEAEAIYLVEDGRIARFHGPFEVVRRSHNVAGEPCDRLARPKHAPVLSAAQMLADALLARAALMKAAMMAGAMEGALAIVLDHAAQRVQFDRPIGQFQAVQHMIAQLSAHTAAVDAAVELAATEGSTVTAAIAKARAGEAVQIVTDAAHQITGAMGFSAEFPLHGLTRRLWAWREESGNERHWHRFVGEAALARSRREGLWAWLSSPEGLAAGGNPDMEYRP